jgi:hypothetical protein
MMLALTSHTSEVQRSYHEKGEVLIATGTRDDSVPGGDPEGEEKAWAITSDIHRARRTNVNGRPRRMGAPENAKGG